MLVIGNGRMITQDASNPFLENGAVAMEYRIRRCAAANWGRG